MPDVARRIAEGPRLRHPLAVDPADVVDAVTQHRQPLEPVSNAGRRAMVGTLSNRQGVMIKLIALDPYAHWNFKPAAGDMWAFLSRFRRNVTTGALQVDSSR